MPPPPSAPLLQLMFTFCATARFSALVPVVRLLPTVVFVFSVLLECRLFLKLAWRAFVALFLLRRAIVAPAHWWRVIGRWCSPTGTIVVRLAPAVFVSPVIAVFRALDMLSALLVILSLVRSSVQYCDGEAAGTYPFLIKVLLRMLVLQHLYSVRLSQYHC